jgi:hypothetical protein
MEVLLIPLTALSIPIIVVPTALAFKHARRVRELEHLERMRAIELGRALPGDESWSIPARIAVAIGAGVPIVSMIIAFLESQQQGYRFETWFFCGCTAIAGVIGGTLLASRHLFASSEAERPASKPVYDPDAFDVVSSRG